MRTKAIRALGCAVLVAMIAALALPASTASAPENVNLALDWVLNGTHAGFFTALEKGYYRDVGLNVAIARGYGSGDTIKRVGAGVATVGVADTGAIIAARANEDIPVRIVAMIYQKATLGIIYLKQSGITKPKDLEGRTIGRSASGASVNMFPGFLKANGIDRSKIREVVVDGATFLPLLLSRKVDAVLEQSVQLGHFRKAAAAQGLTPVAMRYADYGLQAYGNAIIVKPETLAANPEMVRRFVEASLKGIAYSFGHVDEAVASLRKASPEIDAEGAKEELQDMRDVTVTDESRKHGLGTITPERMTATRDVVTNALSLKRRVLITELYTLDFLPKTPVEPTY